VSVFHATQGWSLREHLGPMVQISLELNTHWSSHRPVRASLCVYDPDEEGRLACSGAQNCTCLYCCPSDPATLVYFHCSGRLRCRPVPPGAPAAVLNEAQNFVDRSVGGARHHLLRMASGEILYNDSSPVTAGEVLVIVLHGQCFHLSPLCEGNIMAAWPIPEYASTWLDVATSEITSLSDYVTADRGSLPDESPPPLPSEIYSLAFRLRHGGTFNPVAAKGGGGEDVDEANNMQEYMSHLLSVCAHHQEYKVELPAPPPPQPLEVQGVDGKPPATTTPRKRTKSRRSTSAALSMPTGMCGFTADECELLLTNGLKPWDEDAETVLQDLRSVSKPAGTLV